ncbi:conserved exported hypothetical protein [uncultured Desulfobacterium sp.]|uniref:Uncharacterized protein n=1 Tax=uncultured Desulfobacterium sp. TaxID=201089 RepID=A0A445N3L7_9BACT|nr:conserved exported hypothetical protein [uncultured Desulfobacterium sp.]
MEKRMGLFGVIVLVAIFFSVFPALKGDALAAAKVIPIEGMAYNVDSSLEDNLKALVGKNVSVTVGTGQTLSGILKAVGKDLIHLEKLDGGRDFFDALIRIEDISTIEAKFRDFER